MTEPLVSIVIPTFNRADLIGETINSVLSQTYSNWECIIVDDCSIDGTAKAVSEYCIKDGRFKFLKNTDNKGASNARNMGLKIAEGKYIQFLDSDDIIANNKLEQQVQILEAYDEYTISTCKWVKFDNLIDEIDVNKIGIECRDFKSPMEYFNLIGEHGGFFPSHSFLIPKRLVDLTGHWNENLTMNDDGEFFFRIIINSKELLFSSDTFVLYRNNSNNNLSTIDSNLKANSLVNSWRIIESLYIAKYNDAKSRYLYKKKSNVYYELKRHYPSLISENRDFFKNQIKDDSLLLKLRKLKRRIQMRLNKYFLN